MPAKRVLISIQEQLLIRVDERAARLGIGRSTYLARLAAADLEDRIEPRPDRPATDRMTDERPFES